MDPAAMEPLGRALQAYLAGDSDAELVLCRDDGVNEAVPVGHFFRPESEFLPVEQAALARCRGRVLDVGAGAGLHSLVLQQRGATVTAIDISPQAVEVMRQRGVLDARCADVDQFDSPPFDTLLLMGHGLGMVETLAGLDRFLTTIGRLVAANGQILLDSCDVRTTDDPRHLAYHERNRQANRYIGEVRLRLEFQGQQGPLCGWLHADPETLVERATDAGWQASIVLQDHGQYLAQLNRALDHPR